MSNQEQNQFTNDKNKQQILDAVMKKIEKQFGKGSIMKMGEQAEMDVEDTVHAVKKLAEFYKK